MKEPNYPTKQPKNPVEDALVDRNADPDAQAQKEASNPRSDAPLDEAQQHGKPLLEGSLDGERPRSGGDGSGERA